MADRKSDATRIPEAPGGSRGVTGCTPRIFGGTPGVDPQAHGVDRVTPGLPPGAFGEEHARIKPAAGAGRAVATPHARHEGRRPPLQGRQAIRLIRLTLDPRAPSAVAPMADRKSDATRIPEAPGGSRGVTGCTPRIFGGTPGVDPQAHGVDRVTPGLPPGAFGEEHARIKPAPAHPCGPASAYARLAWRASHRRSRHTLAVPPTCQACGGQGWPRRRKVTLNPPAAAGPWFPARTAAPPARAGTPGT
jgi:hypothetical protein